MRGELRCHVACGTEGSIVKHVEIFPYRTRRLAWINRAGVPFSTRRGALFIRVGLSLFIMLLLMVGIQLGWVTPHGFGQ